MADLPTIEYGIERLAGRNVDRYPVVACSCLCAVRHPNADVCETTCGAGSVFAYFSSAWPDGGRIAVCRACWRLIQPGAAPG